MKRAILIMVAVLIITPAIAKDVRGGECIPMAEATADLQVGGWSIWLTPQKGTIWVPISYPWQKNVDRTKLCNNAGRYTIELIEGG